MWPPSTAAWKDRVPENALLSHDLFEGIIGRAGLVADVVVLENYPDHYLASIERQHRWMRGDWQLLPWLLPWVPAEAGGAIPNDFSSLDRWKILDNLRRSLLAPSVLALLVAGWLWLPGPVLFWTVIAILPPGATILAGLALGLRVRLPALPSFEQLRPLWMDLARWALALVLLPFEALQSLDAIGVTLARLLLTRRRLLEWTPAAQFSRALRTARLAGLTWRRMISAPIAALAAGLCIAFFRPSSLAYAGPLLFAWLISPQVAQWISRPTRRLQPQLTPEQRQRLGVIARRTWLFYERFVGPEDHWLPPDHFQESPRGQAAHHTSPTNVGFLLLSSMAAGDLGYVGLLGLALRLNSTLDALEGLERYRGHFLNWYDTRTLAPLPPRYVSTVDSGNLAACLIALSQGCLGMPDVRVFRWERWQGLLDTLALLGEGVQAANDSEKPSPLHAALGQDPPAGAGGAANAAALVRAAREPPTPRAARDRPPGPGTDRGAAPRAHPGCAGRPAAVLGTRAPSRDEHAPRSRAARPVGDAHRSCAGAGHRFQRRAAPVAGLAGVGRRLARHASPGRDS